MTKPTPESNLEYWIRFSFDKMKQDGATMPTTLNIVLEMEEFKNSGINEDQLRESIKEQFEQERGVLIEKIKSKWNESK